MTKLASRIKPNPDEPEPPTVTAQTPALTFNLNIPTDPLGMHGKHTVCITNSPWAFTMRPYKDRNLIFSITNPVTL